MPWNGLERAWNAVEQVGQGRRRCGTARNVAELVENSAEGPKIRRKRTWNGLEWACNADLAMRRAWNAGLQCGTALEWLGMKVKSLECAWDAVEWLGTCLECGGTSRARSPEVRNGSERRGTGGEQRGRTQNTPKTDLERLGMGLQCGSCNAAVWNAQAMSA